ncbi:MAG: DUF1844 domain-containing protein [Candidatus Omnitrophota bacterium]|nr:DUF1844 domain-containing protein [Candidatus Omnitrophota bacterium]
MDEKASNGEMKSDFLGFISGMLAEGLMALGVIAHPGKKETSRDLRHAGIVIDTLAMLKEKTSDNLSKEESDGLEEVLHQLRVLYVTESGKQSKEEGGKDQEPGEKKEEAVGKHESK